MSWAIGLDVGGTKIAGGIVDLATGHVAAKRGVATQPKRSGGAVLATTLAMAEELIAHAASLGVPTQTLAGIGVGVPELVDPAGAITSDQTIAWRGVDVQGQMARLAPTRVESDVRAAALAEARYGAGRDLQTFVYITIGTGISSCLVQEGRPYAGARGNALVFASGPLTWPCPACGQSSHFVLEEYASGPALVDRYQRQTGRRRRGAEEILAGVAAGDGAAIEVVATAGQAMGAGIGWLVNVLDPEAVIIGGGLGLAGGLYWQTMVEATRSHIWAEAGRDVPILAAATGVDAGIIGAAAAVVPLQQGTKQRAPTH